LQSGGEGVGVVHYVRFTAYSVFDAEKTRGGVDGETRLGDVRRRGVGGGEN